MGLFVVLLTDIAYIAWHSLWNPLSWRSHRSVVIDLVVWYTYTKAIETSKYPLPHKQGSIFIWFNVLYQNKYRPILRKWNTNLINACRRSYSTGVSHGPITWSIDPAKAVINLFLYRKQRSSDRHFWSNGLNLLIFDMTKHSVCVIYTHWLVSIKTKFHPIQLNSQAKLQFIIHVVFILTGKKWYMYVLSTLIYLTCVIPVGFGWCLHAFMAIHDVLACDVKNELLKRKSAWKRAVFPVCFLRATALTFSGWVLEIYLKSCKIHVANYLNQ